MKAFWFDSIYFYAFDVAAVFNYLFILIFALSRWGGKQRIYARSLVFSLMAMNGIISSVLDIATSYVNTLSNFSIETAGKGTLLFWGLFTNFFYLAVHNGDGPLFLLYSLIITERVKRGEKKKEFLVFVPYFVSLFFLIVGSINGSMISFNITYGYQHGPFMAVLYIVSVGYLLMVLLAIVMSQKVLLPIERISALLLWSGIILSVILQALSNGILIELFVQSLMLFAILISLETREASFVVEVACFNGQAFSNYTKIIMSDGRDQNLIILRLDGLDYYARFTSPKEQEAARREFAGLIRKVFSVEDVYECLEGTYAFYMNPITDEIFNSYCDSFIGEYEHWTRHDHLDPMIARLRVPQDAPTHKSVWAFTHSDFRQDKAVKYLVSNESVQDIRRGLAVEQAIIRGLENNTIKTVFQPIVDANGKCVGAEALSRMNDPVLGIVPPYEFITTAESDGLIWRLGLYTMEDACRILSLSESAKIETVDVNLSVVQCLHGGCRKAFLDILKKYGVSPNRINLEITESGFIEDNEIFVHEKDDLKAAGFCFSIDDYGSGFSNYQYVRMVGPSVVKLDRDTLLDAEKGEEQRKFYFNTVKTIRDLGYKVIAEGVETEGQLALVRSAGCDYIQGFYYSKPLSSEDFLKYIR